MGVKRLFTYVEQICGAEDRICRPVSIRDMADLHRLALNTDERPILLVDGANIVIKIYQDSLDWVCGGQWSEAVALLRCFVQKFNSAGIGLIFMFDGPVCPEKRLEWNSRRTSKMRVAEDIIMCMRRTGRNPSADASANDSENVLPVSLCTFLRFALKICCDAEVRSTIKEADFEIAEYAKRDERVFAILAQDTDFLIFDTKPYLSSKHLNLDDLTTVMYDRQRLASKLFLTVEHLPLLSCLLGNDVVPYEQLKAYHRKICWSAGRTQGDSAATNIKDVVPLVAGVINGNKWKGDFRNKKELDAICVEVFGDTRRVDLLSTGLKFYSLSLDESPKRCWTVAVDRHVDCSNFPSVYGLLTSYENDVPEVLEDVSDKSLPPTNLVYRPIAQRSYFLLYEGKSQGILVKEWCAVPRRDLYEPDLVQPMALEALPGKLPSLEELWCGPENSESRLRCFYACLGGRLKQMQLGTVSPKYTILCCVLHYLLAYGYEKCPLLAPWEVSAFIVQAIYPQDDDLRWMKSSEVLEKSQMDTRAVQLAGLFMKGATVLGTVMCICGYPVPLVACMPWNYFDGRFFHAVYLKARDGAFIEELCELKEELIKDFYSVLCVITYGTALADARLFRGGGR